MTGRSNLWPRFSTPARPSDGKISTSYRAFFSRFKDRVGPSIADVLNVSPNADLARAVNEILAEMRAQGWIDPEWSDPGALLSQTVRAVTMIPAATEFGYGTTEVFRDIGAGFLGSANGVAHAQYPETFPDERTDFLYALDNLETSAPNCGAISLFVSWFGDDLRAGNCLVKPKVSRHLVTDEDPPIPYDWRVAGLSRADAETISTLPPAHTRPAFDGTPADRTIVESLAEMRARGYTVSFTPFLLMDVPSGNSLPDPYTLAAGQPTYPWRGRITCFPAPGVVGAPDKTAAAETQIAAFLGTAQPADFFQSGGEIIYGGPAEWSYRRMILHYAHLCALAGGIDIFVIGTELRGLTWVRDSATGHPFVRGLAALAADVKTILPQAQVIYAADWSEYHSYQPPDGSGDLIFHLDELWASPAIDAVGIDCYFPLSDWRDGETHLDYLAGNTSIYSIPYLQSNVFGGEGYDYFYASDADRTSQTRTPITDGAYDKPWVFRYKDLPNWWANNHVNRIGGVEQPASTQWVPKSKPIWFTEVGCPAVDKGANQPNVFVDLVTGSAESEFPYFSSEAPDVTMQRRYNQAILQFFDPSDVSFTDARNPASDVYDGRMIDVERLYLYTWDARPYPAFPDNHFFWTDALNWPTGHWLDGRLPASIPPTQANDGQALLEANAPSDPFLLEANGRIKPRWREFFDRLSFTRGEAVSSLSADASTAEIATTINAIIATLRNQKRIA